MKWYGGEVIIYGSRTISICNISTPINPTKEITHPGIANPVSQQSVGMFDWGVRHVIIFLCAQFWIRLAAVSYRGRKVRTMASPAVRSVNKSRDTRNHVHNKPKYAICALVTTRLYYKALWTILCSLILQIRHNNNRLGDGHCRCRCHGDNPGKFRNDVVV